MSRIQLLTGLVAAVGFSCFAQTAQAYGPRVSFGFNFGFPGYYRPYYGYPYGPYYGPGPYVYYDAAPIIVQPAPVVVQAPSVATPVPAVPAPPIASQPAAPVVPARNDVPPSPRADALLQKLNDGNETTRRDAAMDLGRMKSQQAIDSLTKLLAKDPSPIVRDASARALGLIGSSRSLNALIYAAQADNDRDVRHSAQFAIEVIRTNLRGN